MLSGRQLRLRASKIKLLLMDADGVLTDGKLYHFVDGSGATVEFKGTHSRDGIALAWLPSLGIRTGIISGRSSAGLAARARMLKMTYVVQETHFKAPAIEEILKESGVDKNEAAFVGDDFHDVPAMRRVGLAVAVADARPEVRRAADWVTRARGGDGALREVVELLLKSQGKWQEILARYELDAAATIR
ncbi:MAG: HAD hydrolase family protein [Elusimicrobia bacterium]|nr:HAD hydrolase family protein [Elusimicrobiota bacterium]